MTHDTENKIVDKLKELKEAVDILNGSLPDEVPLTLSRAIDPVRATVFRECCLHRVAELIESAYDNFSKDRFVAAMILTRAYMETETLFLTFVEKLTEALKIKDIQNIRTFLTEAMVGVKDEQIKQWKNPKDPSAIVTPTNILTHINRISKEFPYYKIHYASLSEFSHPNAAGTVDAYSLLDYDNRVVRLGKNQRFLRPEIALIPLVGSVRCFIRLYDDSAKLLEQFVLLCETLLDQTEKSQNKANASPVSPQNTP